MGFNYFILYLFDVQWIINQILKLTKILEKVKNGYIDPSLDR